MNNYGRNVKIVQLRAAGATLAAIGEQFGITRERVRQILDKTLTATSNVTAAGLKPAAFAKACSISRTTLYQLPQELKPKSVKFGRAVVIIEPPAEWLARVAESQLKEAGGRSNDSQS